MEINLGGFLSLRTEDTPKTRSGLFTIIINNHIKFNIQTSGGILLKCFDFPTVGSGLSSMV